MPLCVVAIASGSARLGSWGHLELTGAESAVLRLNRSEDVSLPESVARDLAAGVLLVNDESGRLLFLPYAGDSVIAYDLAGGSLACPIITIPRDGDRGLRMATVRLVPPSGVVYLTEGTLARFDEQGMLAWRRDADFGGWSIEGIDSKAIRLVAADWVGNERRQAITLSDGDVVS